MNRRSFFIRSVSAGMASFIPAHIIEALASDHMSFSEENLMDSQDIIPAPDRPELWEEWRNELHLWREQKKLQLKYNGSSYLSEPYKWVSSDFSCCFIMIGDSDFYDYRKNQYTLSKLIERGKKEYGGYDSIVLWHAYPRIGFDNRNQFDFYREMPLGFTGVKDLVKQFHQLGIKVFINYNPWDKGTRRETKPDIDILADIIRSIDADGIFLDTMKDAPGFRGKLDAVKNGIVMEGEIALPLEHIQTHHMSWAQWFKDSSVPGVYRNKWFERHHMQHAIDRWNSDKTEQLQTAWMNGSGILIWENVFGQWIGWNERDKSIYRSMYAIQHHFSDLFSGEEWVPLSQESQVQGVYVSSWGEKGRNLWTLVNRNDSPAEGTLLKIKYDEGNRYFDLVQGEEILNSSKDGFLIFNGKIGKRGIGCLLGIDKNNVGSDLFDFLADRKNGSKLSTESTLITAKNNNIISSWDHVKYASPPPGMVSIPALSTTLNIEYTFREAGGYGNIREHRLLAPTHNLHSLCTITRKAVIRSFFIDVTPVTNLQFKEFIDASGYKPRIPDNFLKHWPGGKMPPGKKDHPVVYIDLEDARAYCRWAGKRIPTEEEWQFAAQGKDAFEYPWGNEMAAGRYNPDLNGVTTPVKAFPEGLSPFGCYDMCGNTWELTGNEYSDGRTRFVMLKGGSCYKASGSEWYTDGGPQKNSFIAKMLLISPGLDRCATIGFRCAADL